MSRWECSEARWSRWPRLATRYCESSLSGTRSRQTKTATKGAAEEQRMLKWRRWTSYIINENIIIITIINNYLCYYYHCRCHHFTNESAQEVTNCRQGGSLELLPQISETGATVLVPKRFNSSFTYCCCLCLSFLLPLLLSLRIFVVICCHHHYYWYCLHYCCFFVIMPWKVAPSHKMAKSVAFPQRVVCRHSLWPWQPPSGWGTSRAASGLGGWRRGGRSCLRVA